MVYNGEQKTIEQMLQILSEELKCPPLLDYLPVILSVIAIIISGITIFYEIKLNNTNLQSIYFEQIFGEYLKTKIPKVMGKLDFDENGKLRREYREINKVFMAMMRECGYFKYAKNDFFHSLCTKTQELDEYLVELAGKTFLSRKEQDLIKIEVHSKVQDIVQLINRNYQHF